MSKNLLFICAIALIATTGCVVRDGGRGGHARHGHHDKVIVGAPVVVVRPPPVVVVRPPVIVVP